MPTEANQNPTLHNYIRILEDPEDPANQEALKQWQEEKRASEELLAQQRAVMDRFFGKQLDLSAKP